MEHEYSKLMKKLMKKKPDPIVQILLLLLAVIVIVGCVFSGLAQEKDIKRQKENAVAFDSISLDSRYSKLTPEFLSEEFAANYDESIYYCIAIDKDYKASIVAIEAENMDQYRGLIEYTYDVDITETPQAVTLQGIPQEMDDDLITMAVEAYNLFMGGEAVDKDTAWLTLGKKYLDTSQEASADSGLFVLLLFLAIGIILIYALIMMNAEKLSKRRKATLNKFTGRELWDVDQEMKQSTTIYFKPLKLYLTSNYIISNVRGFDIIPYEEVACVFVNIFKRSSKGKQAALTLVTKDDKKHEIAVIAEDDGGKKVIDPIVDRLKQRVPDIQYGFEDGFYVNSIPALGVEVDTDEGDGIKSSNMVLGIFGAVLGAAVGGIAWIVIGEFGFIAGLAGYLMMLFAIIGYRKMSGFLDKKGQIIALIIALIMIFLANHSLYAIEYCKYYFGANYSINNIMNAFKKLPDFITMPDIKALYWKDLIIGYLLSIIASSKIFLSVFSRGE